MAADEEAKGAGETGDGETKPGEPKNGDRRQKDRRRTPVTIDLKAEEVKAPPATPPASTSASASNPSPPPSQPKVEAAGKPEPAADALRATATDKPQQRIDPPFFSTTNARAFVMDDSRRRTLLAGLIGGLAALVLVIVLQALGLLPAPGRSAADAAAEEARAAAEAIAPVERRVSAVEAMVNALPTLRSGVAAITQSVQSLQSNAAGFATKGDVEGVVTVLGQLRQRVDGLPAFATRADIEALTERIGRLEVAIAAGGGSAAGSEAAIASLSTQLGNAESALRSLTDRLAAAEEQMAEIGSPNPMAGGDAAVRAIAITALRRASEGSAPFTSELDMVAALGVSGDEIASLRPYADRGVPARETLVAEFPAVADEILKTSAGANADAGFFGQVVAGLGNLVSIRPAGPIEGTDPQAIVSRMRDAAGRGDLAAALGEREELPEPALAASSEWAASAEERVALDQLVEQIARNLGVITG